MSPMATAWRAGWARGRVELRQSFTNGADLWGHVFWPLLMVVVTYFLRDVSFGGSGFLLGTLVLPSVLGMNASMAMVSMSQHLTADREDGTLLRAKATPNGMTTYLVGKAVLVSGGLVVELAVFLVPALLVVPGVEIGLGSWPTLAWVLALGLLATLPLGAALGSVFTSTRAQGLITLPILALIGVSGVFYPVTAMPDWVQWTAQSFPVYWLGLGTRSALLPDSAVVVEIGGSWRHLETVGALGAWAVFGLLVAPVVLRRMARRESGSTVAGRREKALRRVG
ncbi:ABC transporter permease [Umezawaea sp. Da 62-37]|uniref:ABC transporter permease n=1 Tax=Umezawaea sp. Da 62-37 TaxID=3075927 RepID=UPI0028F714A3|nr:ABC transporter permease [Umezawaea sp. Da 62-37]WNV89860.1 ABC transporter permease [Umezawaea sp. Da 62-37]